MGKSKSAGDGAGAHRLKRLAVAEVRTRGNDLSARVLELVALRQLKVRFGQRDFKWVKEQVGN